MFTSLDILYLSLALGFVVLAGFLSYAAYQLAQTLKSLKMVIEDVEDITEEVRSVKDSVKLGLISLLGSFFKQRR